MPTQTAQQIIATARRNAAALPSEQAAARERRNTARKAAHWAKRRYGSNWLYPAVQLTSPHVAHLITQWAPRTTRYIETPSMWGLYVWNSRRGPEPVLAQEGWYIVRTKYGLRVMQPAVFQQLYEPFAPQNK